MTWEEVNLYGYNQVDVLTQEKLAEKTRYRNGANSTLGGEWEKYWFCEKTDNGVQLNICKKVSPSDDVLIIREMMADIIYESIG